MTTSVQAHGAIGDGLTNDTAAFIAAQLADDAIVIPSGTYRLASTIDLASGKTWISEGARLIHDNDTSPILQANGISDWAILGHLICEGHLTTEASTGEGGLRVLSSNRGYVQRLTAKLFKGRGLEITGSSAGPYRGDALKIDSLMLAENYQGLVVAAAAGCEYSLISSIEAVGNIYPAVIHGGNTRVNGGNIVDNVNGVVLGAGSNHGHGGFHGVNINHNTNYNLSASLVTNGFTFDACHFYGDGDTLGRILLNGCQGIGIHDGIVDAAIDVSGSGRNMFSGNYIAGSKGVTGSGAASLLRTQNYTGAGLWSLNNC